MNKKNFLTMRKMLLAFLLFYSFAMYSQDSQSTKQKIEAYHKVLDLNAEQRPKFKSILKKYRSELTKTDNDYQSFNKKVKLRDLEIYNLLTKEQWKKYKNVKLKIESYLKFRSK